jgi:hypothetical protein
MELNTSYAKNTDLHIKIHPLGKKVGVVHKVVMSQEGSFRTSSCSLG